MTLASPTHTVTLRHIQTGMVSLIQCFSLFHAELTLKVYREYGWTGVVEARS